MVEVVLNLFCVSQLLVATEKWFEALNERISIDVIYLDFKKAFDGVSGHVCWHDSCAVLMSTISPETMVT